MRGFSWVFMSTCCTCLCHFVLIHNSSRCCAADERNVLATMATAILDSLHMSSCVQSTPCRWSETTSAKGALEAAAGADGARASALKQAAIVAGPLSSTPPTVDTVLLDETVVSGSEKAAAAVIKPGPHKPPERQLATAPSKGATRLETRLWELLGERCLYVTTVSVYLHCLTKK